MLLEVCLKYKNYCHISIGLSCFYSPSGIQLSKSDTHPFYSGNFRRTPMWRMLFCTWSFFVFVSSIVVSAGLRFYNSTTVISGRKDQSAVKKQVTKTLNVTAEPEEKRRIIGDTFIKVRFVWCDKYFLCIFFIASKWMPWK